MRNAVTLRRFCLLALLGGASVASCGGPTVIPRAESSALTAASRQKLELVVGAPALRAQTLTVYAYPLTARGPLVRPPQSALTGTFDVSASSPSCNRGAKSRTCAVAIRVSSQTVIAATLRDRSKRTLGQAFAVISSAGTPLRLVAGAATIAQLVLALPAKLNGRFGIGVTALQTEAPQGASPVVMTDPNTLPIDVRVYGPAGVVPSPRATVGGAGVVAAFGYGGAPFVNAMTVTAVAGTASMTGQLFAQRGPARACAPLGATRVYRISEPNALRDGFFLHASVAGSAPVVVQLDTGSTTFLISKNKLSGARADELIGPGQAASETLEPSGITLYGNYYLAPVTLSDSAGTIGTTVPMEVLVVEKSCTKSGKCGPSSTAYLGVGFGRPSPKPDQYLLKNPTENALLQLRDVVTSTMHPGYVLAPDSLTIGINAPAAAGFSLARLDPFPGRPGDWQGPSACLRFNGGKFQCGSMLLDIGIHSMFVAAPTPSPLSRIRIVAPGTVRRYLDYAFDYPVTAGATPPAPDPSASPPIAFPSPGATPYVNTGRYALAAAEYLYDSGCGRVGFKR